MQTMLEMDIAMMQTTMKAVNSTMGTAVGLILSLLIVLSVYVMNEDIFLNVIIPKYLISQHILRIFSTQLMALFSHHIKVMPVWS